MERFVLGRNRYKKFDSKKILLLKCIIVFGMFLVIFQAMTNLVEGTLLSLCEAKVESIAITVSNKAIDDVMEDIVYEDLIKFDKGADGRIVALKADVVEMNNISSEIATLIQNMYDELENIYVYVPLR